MPSYVISFILVSETIGDEATFKCVQLFLVIGLDKLSLPHFLGVRA